MELYRGTEDNSEIRKLNLRQKIERYLNDRITDYLQTVMNDKEYASDGEYIRWIILKKSDNQRGGKG